MYLPKKHHQKLRARTCSLEVLSPRLALTSVVPALSSYPGASHVLFLDFDGQDITGTTWNSKFKTIHSPPFDLDGDPTNFSEAELDRISDIWTQAAEDLRPFDINVTTIDPSFGEPGVFAEPGRAQRVMFTSKFDSGAGGSGDKWFNSPDVGKAVVDSWLFEIDNPVWVFATHANSGTIATHEFGHAIGLLHDGELVDGGVLNGGSEIEYRGAHGSGETRWSPIMGAGSSVLSQWSRGEYENASNLQDDLSFLYFYLGRRPDDHANLTSVELTESDGGGQSFRDEGIIGSSADTDVFSIEVERESLVNVRVLPLEFGANLDVGISLWGGGGVLIPFSDTTVNPVNRLAAGFERVLAPGTYYLTVNGVGKPATADDEGYSDYGSLGYYEIIGNVTPITTPIRGDINADGAISAQDIDAIYAWVGANLDPENEHADLNGDAEIGQADIEILVREVLNTKSGDFNLDGQVDFTDFLLLSANFGQSDTTWASGDTNGDGETDFADFLMLSLNFGFASESD